MFQEKIKPNGAIKIPLEVRRRLKWDIGDEINLFLNPGYVILKEEKKVLSKKLGIVQKVSGNIQIKDQKLIDGIIKSTENGEWI